MSASPQDPSATREIRIALVLYGGVSLAIYENGVTRCFFDLVRGRGVFGPLLDLLTSHATVDVIAGTSAGGINGLLLGACLESGQDFKETANMWRRLGDLGDLMRDVGVAQPTSLLDGEGYYQGQLFESLRKICEPVPGYVSPGEMDIFITGTDVGGHERTYVDGLGATIEDKEHRTVFHLEHRPDRKRLGIPPGHAAVPDTQAAVLAAIARITSCFPVAFPPFHASDMGAQHAPAVEAALREFSGIPSAGTATYVDGGVLDNKPFGPALKAVFHRMPSGPVDRRLFYCEPDPVPFEPGQNEYTPLAIGMSSMTSIPAYESIGGDLEQLKQHNQRIAWLESVKKRVAGTNGRTRNEFPAYVATRIDSASRSLAVDGDDAPSAADVPEDKGRARLLDCLRDELSARVGNELDFLDPWDVHFQLRRAYHFLYEYYERVEAGTASPDMATAMRLVGRIIKSLKLVRDYMVGLRDIMVERVEPNAAGAVVLFDAFVRFLAADAPHWKALADDLNTPLDLRRCNGRERETISSEAMTNASKLLREHLTELEKAAAPQPLTTAAPPSILGSLASKLAEIADALAAVDASAAKADTAFAAFALLDAHLYPLEFVSGVYELDRVEFVRISPGDAQIGLSQGPARDKVAGDELAHFAAFLRRDWRTNDILYGRLDGICQIVRALLDEKALRRVLGRDTSAQPDFSRDRLAVKDVLDQCPDACLHRVAEEWEALRAAWQANRTAAEGVHGAAVWRARIEPQAEAFRTALIVAGQEQAVGEDLASVYADIHYQEIAYGFTKGPRNISSPAKAGLIEQDAMVAARDDVGRVPPEKRSQVFRELRLGAEMIGGARGRVPGSMLGEYSTQAYLLIYGMVERSLGARSAKVLAARQTRFVFRHPPRVIHAILTLIRRERRFGAVLLVALLFAGLGGLGGWWVTAEPWKLEPAYFYVPAVFLAGALLASFFLRSMSRRRVKPCFEVRESKLARAEHREPAGAGAALPAPAPVESASHA